MKIAVIHTLFIKGPATLRLQDGEAEALGISLSYEEPIFVRRNKVLPIEPITKPAYIAASFGPNGCVLQKQIKGGTGLWAKAKELITSTPLKVKRLMIAGASDSGKSTLTTYLLNLAVANGAKIGVVDADIGQSDLAPPGCVGGAVVSKQLIDLRDIRGDVLEFVGSTSPTGIEEFVIKAVERAVKRVSDQQHDLLLVNTDGYVDGEGVGYKIKLGEALSPDLIIYITTESQSNLEKRLVENFGEEKILTLEGAEGVEKSFNERADRRMSQFHHYLKRGKYIRRNINQSRIVFLGREYLVNPGSGLKVNELRILDTSDCIIVNTQGKLVLPKNALEGMFVALGGDTVEGFGRILQGDGEGNLDIWTPLQTFQSIQLSLIKLDDKLRDERIPFKRLNLYTAPLNREDVC
jgi:polynucleotide 5'-hydroxyl-kinase GRC3/NOL9